jgi:nicotinate-nucleotide adenylyltransferase
MTIERIGLLGGTFNPIHCGHLQLADAAMAECSLDKVIFIPSAQPPHKDEASIAPFADRVSMLRIACRTDKRFNCTTIEEDLPVPSYTIDTLRSIGNSLPEESDFFFVIGVDAFLELLTWKSYMEILRRVSLIVAQRRGYQADQLIEFLKKLEYTNHSGFWQGKDGFREIILLHTMLGNYSSTAIRAKIRNGVFPSKDLPFGVIEYIKEHNLYQSNNA